MSHTQVQWARGSTTQIGAYVGPTGELVLNTDDWSLQAQDGVTAGGWVIRPRLNIRSVTGTGAQAVNVTDDIVVWAPTTPAAATFTLPSAPRGGEVHGFKYLVASGSIVALDDRRSRRTDDRRPGFDQPVRAQRLPRSRLYRQQPVDRAMTLGSLFAAWEP